MDVSIGGQSLSDDGPWKIEAAAPWPARVWWNADDPDPRIYWLFPDGVLVPLEDMDDEDWREAIA